MSMARCRGASRRTRRYIDVKIGETALAFFKATNNSSTPVTGQAIFNVAPELAGRYFTKIECFCFKQQTLAPRMRASRCR